MSKEKKPATDIWEAYVATETVKALKEKTGLFIFNSWFNPFRG
jgi:hypothetical protein